MSVRQPAVAGAFYPAAAQELKKTIGRLMDPTAPRTKAIAAILPHAGYRYSGGVAGATYSQLELPRRFIILSPNHTGLGEAAAIWTAGNWHLPMGDAVIDTDLSAALMKNCPVLKSDTEAQREEHALEVQLPFLQYLEKDFTFVAITIRGGQPDLLRSIGLGLAATIRDCGKECLIIASSDMNHYEGQPIALTKDQMAIDKILALDPEGLYKTVQEQRISMCGVLPATIALYAARELGANRAVLVKHATSGDITGDYGSVVGYAGLIIS